MSEGSQHLNKEYKPNSERKPSENIKSKERRKKIICGVLCGTGLIVCLILGFLVGWFVKDVKDNTTEETSKEGLAVCEYRKLTDCSFGSCGISVNCDKLLKTMSNVTTADQCIDQGCTVDAANTVSYYIQLQECRVYQCPQQLGLKLDFSSDINIYMKQVDMVTDFLTVQI